MAASLLVVVLHYRGVDDTLECLASLARQTCPDMRVLLVDNGSTDFAGVDPGPGVELLRTGENLGWSGGNNAGIRLALQRGVDLVCLLNNDTVLADDALARLVATAVRLGPCILHPAIDFYAPGEGAQLDPSLGEPDFLTARLLPGERTLYEVDSPNGACLLAHRALIEAVGLIDDRFFLLCEDADFGRRAVRAGFRMYCDVAARIRHKESRAFGGRRTPIKTYYGIRNDLLFQEKHEGWRRILRRTPRHVLWTAYGAAAATGARPASWWALLRWSLSADPHARALRLGVRDYLRRRFGRIGAADAARLGGSPGQAG